MEQERIVKGIWIPIEIWKDKNLTWNEKILYLEIDSFSAQDKDCFLSNEYIANLLDINITNASKTLSSLVEKGYIVRTRFDGKHRFVKPALSNATTQPCRMRQPSHARGNNISTKNNNIFTNIDDKEKELKEKFAEFVKLYKKLTGKNVRGIETEFNDFSKRHKDWKEVVPYLSLAIRRESNDRAEAKAKHVFFPEPKMLQTYLGKQRAWEMYVTIGEDLSTINSTYTPQGRTIWFNDGTRSYWTDDNFYYGTISDGYDDETRPDGATLTLNNARGDIYWDKKTKKWNKK